MHLRHNKSPVIISFNTFVEKNDQSPRYMFFCQGFSALYVCAIDKASQGRHFLSTECPFLTGSFAKK